MKLIYSIAFTCVLFCSCKKTDYTCRCTDTTGTFTTKEITVSERTQSKAVSECSDQEIKLNKSGSSFQCALKP